MLRKHELLHLCASQPNMKHVAICSIISCFDLSIHHCKICLSKHFFVVENNRVSDDGKRLLVCINQSCMSWPKDVRNV